MGKTNRTVKPRTSVARRVELLCCVPIVVIGSILLAAVGGVAIGGLVDDYRAAHRQVEVIDLDNGDVIDEFIERYADWRRRKVKVVLDGPCVSACTMITGLIPNHRVCVTPRASLAFHSAYYETGFGRMHSSEGTRFLWHIYPENVRALLREKFWDGDNAKTNEHPDLIYVEGAELAKIYQSCPDPLILD